MNVAFVNSTRKWGGVKTWSLDVSVGLQELGHNIYTFGRQEHFINSAKEKGCYAQYVNFGFDVNPSTIFNFYQLFDRFKIDIVLVNVEKELSTAGLAAKLLNIPVVQQIGLPNDIPYRLKTTLLHKFIDPYFLCSCRFIADGFLKSLPYLNQCKVKTILTAKTTTNHALSCHNPCQLIMTQQLNADKGHATILKALAKVDAPFILNIVGTGTDEQKLKDLAIRLNINDKIVWHGFTTDIYSLLRQADIFLLASLFEGLPNTLQEALACGLLPVIRNVGGVCEVLSAELLPFVLPYDADEFAFAAYIEKAIKIDSAELLALREKARTACRNFCEQKDKTKELEMWFTEILTHNIKRA